MKVKLDYDRLIMARDKLLAELGKNAFVLRGSLRRHGNICGNPTCRCKHPEHPRPHGPYDYLSHRYKNKTRTIFLNKKKLSYAREGIANYNKLWDTVYRLSEINFRILRFHYDKLGDL